MVVWPGFDDVIVNVQLPVVPIVVQEPVAGVAFAPLLFVTVKLIAVPAGALTKLVAAFGGFDTLTWAVRTWFVPTSFALVSGAIWMLASTKSACSDVSPQKLLASTAPLGDEYESTHW